MYFITYIDRVNFSTAAIDIQPEFGLNNTQLGFIFSAFNYSYFFFQIIGGWIGDRYGPRKTLFACGAVWAVATILTGFSGGIVTLIPDEGDPRLRRRRDLPDRDPRHAKLGRAGQARLRAGPHPFLRASRQRDHAARRRFPDDGRDLARLLRRGRMHEPDLGASSGRGITATIRRISPTSPPRSSPIYRRHARDRDRKFPGGRSASGSGRGRSPIFATDGASRFI